MNDADDRERQPPSATAKDGGHANAENAAATLSTTADAGAAQFAHASKFAWPVVFAEAAEPAEEQLEQGAERDDGDAEAVIAAAAARDHWKFEGRPPWQQHSELGPNPGTATLRTDAPPLPDIVNPADHDNTDTARISVNGRGFEGGKGKDKMFFFGPLMNYPSHLK